MGSGNKKNWNEDAKIKFQLQKENSARRNIIKNDKHKYIRKNLHRKKHNKKTARFPEIKTTYLNRNLKNF